MSRRLLLAGRIGPQRHHIGPDELLGENLREVSLAMLHDDAIWYGSWLVSSLAPKEHVAWTLELGMQELAILSGRVTGDPPSDPKETHRVR